MGRDGGYRAFASAKVGRGLAVLSGYRLCCDSLRRSPEIFGNCYMGNCHKLACCCNHGRSSDCATPLLEDSATLRW